MQIDHWTLSLSRHICIPYIIKILNDESSEEIINNEKNIKLIKK